MSARLLHRIVGIVMLLPLAGWALTGAIFFIKPGYAGAYDQLSVKTYAMDGDSTIRGQVGWREARYIQTILGLHLLVRTEAGWTHLNPSTLQPAPVPPPPDIIRLLEDAFSVNPKRYGRVVRVVDRTAGTDTGVDVILDWNRLALQQRGRDTDRIDWFYKVHYLQWTGHRTADKALGLGGLTLLVALSVLGARLAFWRRS